MHSKPRQNRTKIQWQNLSNLPGQAQPLVSGTMDSNRLAANESDVRAQYCSIQTIYDAESTAQNLTGDCAIYRCMLLVQSSTRLRKDLSEPDDQPKA